MSLYGQHPEVLLMLMSSNSTQCHYILRVDERKQSTLFQGFPRHSEFKSIKKVYPSPGVFGDVSSYNFLRRLAQTVRQLFVADDFSRRHFQMHFFLGALRVKICKLNDSVH